MALLSGSAASLRFFGDDLDPDELTKMLGGQPTKSEEKGDEFVGKVTGQKRIAQCGGWWLSAERREPGDFDAQISPRYWLNSLTTQASGKTSRRGSEQIFSAAYSWPKAMKVSAYRTRSWKT